MSGWLAGNHCNCIAERGLGYFLRALGLLYERMEDLFFFQWVF